MTPATQVALFRPLPQRLVSPRRVGGAGRLAAGGSLVLAALLGACAHAPSHPEGPRTPLTAIVEPAPQEVVVVVNANSYGGAHAGMFAGAHLYDPSGTYVGFRSEDRSWRQPSLVDYLRFHLRDGPYLNLYRFRLSAADFAAIESRIDQAGWTMPMFCATGVQGVLAGIGPFRKLESHWWISPVQLGDSLQALELASSVAGLCSVADGRPC